MTKKIHTEAGLLFELPGLSRKSQVTMTMDEFNNWLDDEVEEYNGGQVEGVRQGHGTGRWPDGKEYVGQWQNGDRHGQGTVTWPNGQKYIGEWQGDFATGKAVLSKPDGTVYAGEFLDSQRHGLGTQTYANGATYTGGWKDDHPEGWGVICTVDGKHVFGRFGINQRHGRGVQFFENGDDDDNNRIYWEEGELISQSEWFSREQAQNFVSETNRLGIPFCDNGPLSRQEKIHILAELADDSFLELPGVFHLAMESTVYIHKQGIMDGDISTQNGLASVLGLGQAEILAFSRERALPVASGERLALWAEWSISEEKEFLDAHFKKMAN